MHVGPMYHTNCGINVSAMELGFNVDVTSEAIQPVAVDSTIEQL